MSLDTNRPLLNGSAAPQILSAADIKILNDGLKETMENVNASKLSKFSQFHGDPLLAVCCALYWHTPGSNLLTAYPGQTQKEEWVLCRHARPPYFTECAGFRSTNYFILD